ncbi:hypothetical protein A2U01_0066952, partial [Trifolium medium]|nr:hypothetical protein [Trifolium medium]
MPLRRGKAVYVCLSSSDSTWWEPGAL